MKSRWLAVRVGLLSIVAGLLVGAGPGCAPDTAPQGVRVATKYPGGPTIAFDLSAKPLPELPLPNDVGTWPDATSRTGRRINVSLVAPTEIEKNIREKFSKLEGWGTFAPISIPFDKPIDTEDVKARQQDDDFDFTNDAVYLVNLKTGVPVPLDLGEDFPVTLRETDRYWPNDPGKTEANLLFETREEDVNGNGRMDQGEDTDFDGVLDHPNFPGKIRPANGVDGLLTFWESETNTLIMRPMIPLDEMTEYAVVVTDRLHGSDAQKTPVQSPFDYIHHPSQRQSTQRLADAMARRSDYYGFAGSDALSHVQFVFTFTTQPTTSDLFAMRDGVYGKGNLSWIGSEYPAEMKLVKAVGHVDADDPVGDPADTFTCTDDSPACQACKQQTDASRFVAHYTAAMHQTIAALTDQVFGFSGPAGDRLVSSFDNVAYLAVGTMKVPWLLGDVLDVSPEKTIEYDPQTGNIPHSTDELSFFIVVPKTTATHKPPFPVALYGHGYTGNGTEGLTFAGDMARHGIVTIGMNAPGHGLELSEGDFTLAKGLFGGACLTPFAHGFNISRVRDLNGDGIISGESGGDYWTSYLFHTRDMVRQAVVEQMMMIRLLRTFDGSNKIDWKGDGSKVLAGDFDEDGVVDFGGPNAKYFAWGESLGGILSGVQGGVDPYLTATAPVSGGGALTDVGVRSFQGGVVEAVQMRLMSPLLISVPAESRFDYLKDADGKIVKDKDGNSVVAPKSSQTQTLCDKGQRSIRFFVVDLNKEREIEIACANDAEIGEGMDVVVLDVDNNESRCAKVTKANSDFPDTAQFRLAIPASRGDRLLLSAFKPGPGQLQAVNAYGKDCQALPDAVLAKELHAFQGLGDGHCIADTDASDATKCDVTYESQVYHYGSPLVAVAEGYGLRRQTPDLRKLLTLAQIALEPADPITFAPYYYTRVKPDLDGNPSMPTGVLTINTIGDMNVPVSTGIAAGRVHGAIPFLKPDNVAARDYPDYVAPQQLIDLLGGKTPNRVLIENHVIEGIARLGRHPAGATCEPNVNAAFTGCGGATTYPDRSVCDHSLLDPENLSEGSISYDPQTLSKPLRLARIAQHASEGDLQTTWGPRLSTSWTPGAVLGATLQPFIVPQGVHGFDPPDPCKLWDDGSYLLNTLAHFFATNGQDLYYLSHPVTDPTKPESDHRCAAVTDPSKGCSWGD